MPPTSTILRNQAVNASRMSTQKSKVSKLMNDGYGQIKLGRFDKAKQFFLDALKVQPNNSFILGVMGAILLKLKKYSEAGEYLIQAIRIDPNNPEFYCNYGVVLRELKQYEDALKSYDRAIEINPNYAEAYRNRGNLLQAVCKLEEALSSYGKAITIDPNYVPAHNICGNILNKLERYSEAIACFDKAIVIDPNYAPAHNNRGVSLYEIKDFSRSLDSFEKAVEINPFFIDAHNNLGKAFIALERFNHAISCFDDVLEINCNDAKAHMNRAVALQNLKEFDKARQSYERAIQIDPNYVEAFINLGSAFQEINLFKYALAMYDEAIRINPDDAQSHSYKALLLLSLGEFKKGWLDYEYRFKTKVMKRFSIKTEKPEIEVMENNSKLKVLIWSEQGIGDQIFYSSVLSEIVERLPKAIITIDDRLIPIFKRSFPEINFISNKQPISEIDFDAHIPLVSCMKYFRGSIMDVSAHANPFIKPNNAEVNNIKPMIKERKNLICGITWKSKNDTFQGAKSISLDDLLPILEIPGVTFVNLQYGDVRDELLKIKNSRGIEITDYSLIDNFHDLDGHANLIGACDFLVGISNSSAHFAGSMGKEMHMLYPKGKGSLWYWANQINGKNIWYPSISIYQQTEFSSWEQPILRVRDYILNKIKINYESNNQDLLFNN